MSVNANRVQLLYVEDEVLVQCCVEASLIDAGFEPLVASCGDEALAMLEASHGEIQGLVTDVRLGNGPDGWRVASRARELLPALPVIYASAGSATEWFSKGVPLSVMIEKPFVPTQVIVAMALLMSEPLPKARAALLLDRGSAF